MPGPYASLINATTGNGNAVDFNVAIGTVMFEIIPTGTIAGGTVSMKVSPDGVNWFQPPTSVIQNFSGATQANPYVLVTGTNALFDIGTVEMAIRYARADVGTNVTGGGSVSVYISGK